MPELSIPVSCLGPSLWKCVQKASSLASQSEFPLMEQLKEHKLFGLEASKPGGEWPGEGQEC